MGFLGYLYNLLIYGIPLLAVFFLLIIFKLDVIERVVGKFLSLFLWMGSGIRKEQISRTIRGDILKVSKKLNKELSSSMVYDLKVKWVKETDKESFIENNKVVIRMDNKKSKTKNTVYALHQFVEKGLLHKIKSYFDDNVMKAMDHAIVRKLLYEINENYLVYYDKNYIENFTSDSEAQEIFNQIIRLDRSGMLTSVLLKEFYEKGNLLWPDVPDECLKIESRQFLRFLYDIANKNPGEDVDLSFIQEYFKVAVVILARAETLKVAGQAPYFKRACGHISDGAVTIYLLADQWRKVKHAENIAEKVKNKYDKVKSIKKYPYIRRNLGQVRRGACIAINTYEQDDAGDDN